MLRVIDLSKVYNGNIVLRGVNLEVEGFVGVFGPNGSGKSTLLKIIAGLEKPTCGRIIFEGEDITAMPPEKVARKGISMVFQISRPFKNLSVVENIATPLLLSKTYREALERAWEICEFVGLDALREERAGKLSQGELRLLEIGRALAMQPKLLLLDEPFSGLDVENTRRVIRILGKIKGEGVSALITAHRMKLLREIADRSYEMRGENLLKAENISVKLNGREILKKVTCWVDRREIMLVLGPNGSGKSTLLKAIMGVVEHDGRVFLDGEDVTALNPSERYRLGLTLAPERLRVAKKLTVEENLSIAGDVEGGFELFPELRALAKKKAGKLSGGERQMVVLARAFISNPKYLLLDEPFQGLFREVRARVVDLIHEVSKKSGVVVVTHDEINEVFPLSDKTCVLVGGEAIYFGESDGAEKLVKEMFL